MAGLLVAAVFQGTMQIHNAVQDRRSPLLPVPPSSLGPSTHITERDLKQTLRTWQARLQTLEAKVRALKHCKAKGETECWAGHVRTLRPARKARDESRWVAEQLSRALDWCRLQDVKKGGYGLVTLSRSSPKRPSHSATPPALFELPNPLPRPLAADDYTLSVVRPVVEIPPAYSSNLHPGEKVLSRTEIERTDSFDSLDSDES